MYFAFAIICLVFFSILLRCFQIQIFNYKEYKKIAENISILDVYKKPPRGIIYDRNMNPLVSDKTLYSYWMRYKDIESYTRTEKGREKLKNQIESINQIIKIDVEDINKKIELKKDFSFEIIYNASKEKSKKIDELSIPWLAKYSKEKRNYIFDVFASSLIGRVDGENNGIAGIEMSMNTELSGFKGRTISKTDLLGSELAFERIKKYEPVEAKNVVLTIDRMLQLYLEKALKESVKKTKVTRATAILMKSKTGEILAMGSYPSFNLNDNYKLLDMSKEDIKKLSKEEKNKILNERFRNYVTSWTYEPGSVSKLITTAAGIEEGVYTKNSTFVADKPYVEFNGGSRLNCWYTPRHHGTQTVEKAVNNSCNVALIKMGYKLGKEKLFKYMNALNLTVRTGIEIPAEEHSLFIKPEKINDIERSSMTFGHGYQVTPLQMLAAVNSFSNNGELVKPQIIKKIIDKNDKVIYENKREVIRKVFSKKTSDTMLEILKSTADFQTSGYYSRLGGIDVGSKTGTTLKLQDGSYNGGVYLSYYLVAPVKNPKYSLLIVMDSPSENAHHVNHTFPLAREIITNTFNYFGKNKEDLNKENLKDVPNVTGMKVDEAIKVLKKQDFTYYLNNYDEKIDKQIVLEQFPKEGVKSVSGSKIILNIGVKNE